MPVTVVLTIQDRKGKQSTTEFNLLDGISIENAERAAKALAYLVEPLITGSIVGISLAIKVALPVLWADDNGIADASDVEEGARFGWVTDTGFAAANRLPTFKESLILTGTSEVNRADTAVAAFITNVTGSLDLTQFGGVATTVVDKRGAPFQRLAYARESFIASRRRD